MTFTHALSTNNYGPVKFIVSSNASQGTHTTIASALAVASSGDVIAVRPGTYTENLTLPAGVTLVTLINHGTSGSGDTAPATIIGQITMTVNGNAEMQGFAFQTNAATLISLSGASTSFIRFYACSFLNASTYSFVTCSNANASVVFDNCSIISNDGSTAVFSITTCNNISCTNGTTQYNAAAASTIAAGTLNFTSSGGWSSPITTSGTAALIAYYSTFNQAGNSTITCGGSGTHQFHDCIISGGSASAVTVNNTTQVVNCEVSSSNTNAITGSGTLNAGNIQFTGSSKTINTTVTAIAYRQYAQPGLILLSTQTASASSSLSFTSLITSAYSSYQLIFSNLVLSSGVNLFLQISTNNGSSYISSGYTSGLLFNAYNANTFSNTNSATGALIINSTNLGAGYLYLFNLQNGANFQAQGVVNFGTTGEGSATLTSYNATASVNAIQIIPASGTITTGTFSLYGIAT